MDTSGSGFNPVTRTFHTLRPAVPLPPLSLPLSAADFVRSFLGDSPPAALLDKPAFIDSATAARLSYRDFLLQVRALTAALHTSHSLHKGDVAYVLAPASLHIPVLYFSLLSLGVVVSAANPLSSPAEIDHQLRLCRPRVAFATSAAAQKLPSHLLEAVILLDSPNFLSSLERSSAADALLPVIQQLDPAAILFSSGTSGRFKGVVLTHRNLIAVTAGMHALYGKEVDGPGVSLFTVPLFHVYGFFLSVRAVALQETVVLMERFQFGAMLRAIEDFKVNYMPLTPPLVVALGKSPEVDRYDLSSLSVVACGGAPLGKEMAEAFGRRFPNVFINQGYGMTESCGVATRTLGRKESQRYGSAGRLGPETEAKVVHLQTGEGLPPGEMGELWLRGPNIMKGYIGDDEATALALDSEGWLKTGDIGYFDEDGFLYIVDRLKELIKYKAYQVAPAELEAILQSHPAVADAAVIPYPDEEAGQIPMAYVVRKAGSTLSESEIIDFIAKQVAPYKKIRRVDFIAEIPKSAAGKILRRELVDRATST